MTIEQIKISDLKVAEYNPRIMPEHEAAALKKSIATFGFVEPVIVNMHKCENCGDRKNILIGGHQRLVAVEGDPKFESVPGIYLDLHLPQIKWVISYADGTQAGSGTIYRASGFVLTGPATERTRRYFMSQK